MTETKEYRFCNAKGDIVVFDMRAILKTLKSQKITFENIFNAFTIAKECILGKSDSWLVSADFKTIPVALTIPVRKRKLSEEEIAFMTKCYEESRKDDLALAKECEGMDSDFDFNSSE